MAFVSRSRRRTNEDSGLLSTGAAVGPGAYVDQEKYSIDHAYAPFGSTNERALSTSATGTNYTPGPGAYLADAPVTEYDAASNVFVSNVSRFHKDKTTSKQSPGPGAYVEGNTWVKNTHRYKPEPHARRVTFQRMPTAPSVPARNQSYGYEDAGNGELVMQKAPDKGHTGIGSDSVGPAVYNPEHKMVLANQSLRHTDFSKSRSSRTTYNLSANPGPGQYDPKVDHLVAGQNLTAAPNSDEAVEKAVDEILVPRVNATVRTSSFASRVPKAHETMQDEEKATPGPGAYMHKQQFKNARVPETQQFFLSTSRRGYEVDLPSQLAAPTPAKTPGPGAYDERRTAFIKQQQILEQAPFQCTSLRFEGDKAKQAMPGPGAYDENNEISFTIDMTKKVVSRNGVFGSTTERFSNEKSHTSYLYINSDDTPGPGGYEHTPDPNASLARLRRKETSNFASATTRFNKTAPADPAKPTVGEKHSVPPPGAYEIGDQWAGSNGHPMRRCDAFISKETRFKGVKTTESAVPGPGTYNAKAGAKNGIVATNRSCFVSNSNRFKSSRTIAPGPGSYESEDPNSTMVKRSFNVTIDGVLY